MAVHELATNAVKYGALSNELGRIDITWNIIAPEDVLSVQWAEINGPEYIPATRSGFGQAVIKRMVEEASGGKVEIGFGGWFRLMCRVKKKASQVLAIRKTDKPRQPIPPELVHKALLLFRPYRCTITLS